MPTIQLQANVSPNDLLRAVGQLDARELDEFLAEVLAIRARRQSRCLPLAEADLLQRINQGLPAEQHDRYQELITKRQAKSLTPTEISELLQLTDQSELLEADRAAALVELARLRQVSVDDLIRDLGLRPSPDG
jgi:hypothetical protein